MTLDENSEHAPFTSSTASQPGTTIMPTSNSWMMDDSTRNRLLKKYKTQVASATSTVCATLAVVRDCRISTEWGKSRLTEVSVAIDRHRWRM